MKFRVVLAAATCLALPLAAHAQPVVGPYVNLTGGTSIQYPINLDATPPGGIGSFSGKFLYRPAYVGLGGIGYGLGMGFRAELDGDYDYNTAVKVDLDGGLGGYKLSGHAAKYGPMVNLLYDLSLGLPIYPYVGAGVGYQFTNGKYKSDVAGAGFGSSGTKGSFAFDAILGVAYPIDAVPGLSIVAQGTFLDLTESYKYTLSETGAPTAGTIKIDDSSFLLTGGLRYALFPAPAPAAPPVVAPPAAPAPVAARTYLVFFDWDKYNLTPRALEIISEAASDSKSAATTTLDVSGYTDTSGTPVYNQGLSERRAKAVAAQLVTDGVPESEIAIHAYGETHLLVPTGPGVREPQNRRVEIVLQ
jgi:outer membrane protein OmpA-like peptidoglycan-associated protein/opacity protein-like surface antigen